MFGWGILPHHSGFWQKARHKARRTVLPCWPGGHAWLICPYKTERAWRSPPPGGTYNCRCGREAACGDKRGKISICPFSSSTGYVENQFKHFNTFSSKLSIIIKCADYSLFNLRKLMITRQHRGTTWPSIGYFTRMETVVQFTQPLCVPLSPPLSTLHKWLLIFHSQPTPWGVHWCFFFNTNQPVAAYLWLSFSPFFTAAIDHFKNWLICWFLYQVLSNCLFIKCHVLSQNLKIITFFHIKTARKNSKSSH